MNIKVGSTSQLKALFEDEEAIMGMLDKVNHALRVHPRDFDKKTTQLCLRHELMVTQGLIRKLQKGINK